MHSFTTRCLRFTNRVASAHARLTSGWLASLCREGVEPSGLLRKVSVLSYITSPFPGLTLTQVGLTPDASSTTSTWLTLRPRPPRLWLASDLYGIEEEIRGKPAELRCSVRQARARPLLDSLRHWMEKALRSLSPKSDTAAAIRYALSHWRALNRYVDDGLLEIDNSAAERSLRAVVLGRKLSLHGI